MYDKIRELRYTHVTYWAFELIGFDFVSNPSTHGAFLRPVNESVDKSQKLNKWVGVEKAIRSILTGE